MELPNKVKPASIVVKAGDQTSIVKDLAVLMAVYAKTICEFNEGFGEYLTAGNNKIAAAITGTSIRVPASRASVGIRCRLAVTAKFPFSEYRHAPHSLFVTNRANSHQP
jgi:hypothetical protein